MPRRHGRTTPLSVLLVLTMVVCGCSGPPKQEQEGPSPDQVKIENLSRSLDILRDSLRATAEDRDDYKQRFQGSSSELRARRADSEYFETLARFHRQRQAEWQNVAQERDQEIVRLQEQVATVEASLEGQTQDLESAQAKAQRVGDEVAQLQEQLLVEGDARQKLEKQLEVLEKSLRDRQRNVADQSDTAAQALLDSQEQVGELQAEVADLKKQLVASESLAQDQAERIRDAAAARAKGQPVVATSASATAGTTSTTSSSDGEQEAAAFLAGWWQRSVSELTQGQWNSSNQLLVGIVAGALFLVVMFVFYFLRANSALRTVRRLRSRIDAENNRAHAGAAARFDQAAPEPTIQMPTEVPPAPPALEPDMVTMQIPASAAGSHHDDVTMQVPADALNPEVTQHIDSALTESEGELRRGRRVLGASRGEPAGGGVDEQALLSDLKTVISEKFSGKDE